MVYKIRVCTSSCPYCGTTIGKEYNGPGVWGLKFGRCSKCKNIFRTGKKLYSDISQAERDKDRKEFIQAISITIPLFFISLLITILTGWELVGLLSFLFFIGTLVCIIPHFQKRKIVLSKYDYLKKSDPELYQLEYDESVKLLGHQSIDEIEYNIKNAIEHQIIKYLGCLGLGILASELVLMLILGDSVEGAIAILLLFVVSIPISFLFYYLFWGRKKSTSSTPKDINAPNSPTTSQYSSLFSDEQQMADKQNKNATPVSNKRVEELLSSLMEDGDNNHNQNTNQANNAADTNIKFCRTCGNKLVAGSLFCNKCGTKIDSK